MSLFSNGYNRTELLSQAARARARGRRKKAIALYLRVLDNEPDNDVLHKRVAQLLAQSRRMDEALEHYRKAADGLVRRGFQDHAIAVYRESLHFEPRVTWVWTRVAALEAARGYVGDAVETLRNGARCFRSRKDRPQAIALLEQAHRLDPGSADAALDLAHHHAKERRHAYAYAILEEVIPHARGKARRRLRARQLYLRPTPLALARWLLAWWSRGQRTARPIAIAPATG
jgi:tetratricopeptide (TPR) repeat protein